MKNINRVLSLLFSLGVCFSTTAQSDEPKRAASAASMLGTAAGQARDDNALKMKLVWCPPGAVMMKNGDETPARAFLRQGYWLGKCEVTQSQWVSLMSVRPWKGNEQAKEGEDFPASGVNWDDAVDFCCKMTERERQADRLPENWQYALPTEAQWERACRAGTESRFSYGDDRDQLWEYAWIHENATGVGERYAHAVGRKTPNAWGLYDIHGNVAEWCADQYAEKLPGGVDPLTELGVGRVIRGGGFLDSGWGCGSAERSPREASINSEYIGFRVALTPVRPAADSPAK